MDYTGTFLLCYNDLAGVKAKSKIPLIRIRVRTWICQNSITFISLEMIPYVRTPSSSLLYFYV